MTSITKDILLIQSFNLDSLVEEYKVFFLGLLPAIFIMACIVEYFDRLDTASLVKRALISILILSGMATFYKSSIDYSFKIADDKIGKQKESNILLMDFLDGAKKWGKIEADRSNHKFYKDNNSFTGTLAFLKYHLFTKLINPVNPLKLDTFSPKHKI